MLLCLCVNRAEQLYQKVMSLWHQLHVNMKSVVSWHYLLKDIRTVSGWNLDTVRLGVFVFSCSVSICCLCSFFIICPVISPSAASCLPSPRMSHPSGSMSDSIRAAAGLGSPRVPVGRLPVWQQREFHVHGRRKTRAGEGRSAGPAALSGPAAQHGDWWDKYTLLNIHPPKHIGNYHCNYSGAHILRGV